MIETVKIQGEGYLVNGALSVPKANGNRHYEEIKQFIADGGAIAEEFTQGELDQQVKDKRIIEIDARLDEIDRLSIRSLRSINRGRGNAQDDTTMTELDDEAIALRAERGVLTV